MSPPPVPPPILPYKPGDIGLKLFMDICLASVLLNLLLSDCFDRSLGENGPAYFAYWNGESCFYRMSDSSRSIMILVVVLNSSLSVSSIDTGCPSLILVDKFISPSMLRLAVRDVLDWLAFVALVLGKLKSRSY